MSRYEKLRRKADKWLCNEVMEDPGYFDFRWRMFGTKYRIKAFSITWIVIYLMAAVIGTFALWAFCACAIVIGG